MNTEKLYDADSHLFSFQATVLSVTECPQGFWTELDRTAFFPEGGGQASDRGTLDAQPVTDVQITDGVIRHLCQSALPVGQTVQGEIDRERRLDFMQQHSGEHIVSGIAHALYGCENVGFHLGEDSVTLDFDKMLSEKQLERIETEANETIYRNAAFHCFYPDKETLSGLSYRSKKELTGAVRIVEIAGTDVCACCAPHVSSACEIGLIKLLDPEKIRGGIRIYIQCGRRALEDYRERYRNTAQIGNLLAVKQADTADGVRRMLQHQAAEKNELSALKRRLAEQQVQSFRPSGETSCLFTEEADSKDLQVLSDMLVKQHGGIRAVLTPKQDGFFFAVCGQEEKLSPFFARFRATFPVKGGGRNGMVQGTVVGSREEIESFFK